MNLKDLVVLKFSDNTCYTSVVNIKDIKDESFNVDIKNKTWSYKERKNVKIGNSRNLRDNFSNEIKYGVIGVYNRKLINNLNSLVFASKEFTESHAYSIVDD